jgi:hypothetical protein
MRCPFGCNQGFADYKALYTHLIDRHPEKAAQQAQPLQ